MTTGEVGAKLGVSAEFVRGEILSGRLTAQILRRPGKRTVYRVTPQQFESYLAAHWSGVPRGTTNQQSQ